MDGGRGARPHLVNSLQDFARGALSAVRLAAAEGGSTLRLWLKHGQQPGRIPGLIAVGEPEMAKTVGLTDFLLKFFSGPARRFAQFGVT